MSGFRLAQGGAIDRSRPIRFTFDDVAYQGYAGDTLASALLASGVRLLGRSFKYHRPRGVMTAGPEEPSALVTIRSGGRREANVPATMVELYDGLEAWSQNRWPSLGLDLMAVNSLAAPLLPAGFYYKTFMRPKALWEALYEPLIRRAAGLGRAGMEPDPDHCETIHAHCDLLVIGSGVAGLSAAREGAESGLRVMLVEQDRELGGGTLVDPALTEWRRSMLAALRAQSEATLLTRTTAVGAYDSGVVAAVERVSDHCAEPPPFAPRQRLHVIRPGRTILASGAVERLIALPNNDRPGVMLATAARAYASRYGVLPGRRMAAFINNDEAYAAIRDLRAAGVEVAAVADPRPPTAIAEEAKASGLPVFSDSEISAVRGRRGVSGAMVRHVASGKTEAAACDLVILSGGYTPQTQLATQAGLRLVWRDDIAGFAAAGEANGMVAAGAAAGVFGRREAAEHGAAAGRAAAEALRPGSSRPGMPDFPVPPRRDGPILPHWEVRGGRNFAGKAFVDLQHDVTTEDIRLAHREGYVHVEHAKRYTAHGMGTDQGKIGGLVGSAVLAEARGEPVSAIGLSKPRPFVTPVAWGTLAGGEVGEHFKPERRLPLHDWHRAQGAVFVRIGLWLRPLVYSSTGDTSWGPVLEEVRAVRRSVGITDASSLGKIDVQGRDAASFLDRIYANTFSTLPVGKARYGLMLREDGLVLDDGTTSRLAEDHFIVTTTTGQAQAALEHLEFHRQTAWRDLDVRITNVADHWAQFAVAGPQARVVLERVVDPDLSDEAFPFMAAGEAKIAGLPGRLFRISFSGELAYEVAVPARLALGVWEAILAAGAAHGIRPYGLDALNVMRIEKGHVAGSELNGQVTAGDLGLGKMLKKNGDFIGKALAGRPGLTDPNRLGLVGLHPVDNGDRLRNGAHLVSRAEPRRSQGCLTAACMASEGPHDWIGLAMIEGGARRIGERLIATSPVQGEAVEVEIVSHHRLDPENKKVKGAASDGRSSHQPPHAEEARHAPSRSTQEVGASFETPATRAPQDEERRVPAPFLTHGRHGADGSDPIRLREIARDAVEIAARPGATPSAAFEGVATFAIAPGLAMAIGRREEPGSFRARIAAAVGASGSVVDVGHGLVFLELSGRQSRGVLAKICRLDLHDSAFGVGASARTITAQIPTMIWRIDDTPSFGLAVPLTFAQSFAHILLAAASEAGCEVLHSED
jgi:sarcosine oxidase subunit alpha